MSRGKLYYKDDVAVFDLHVSFASDVTPEQIEEWRQSWAHASQLLFKATHGQMRFGTISFGFNPSCGFADGWLLGRKGRSYTDGHITGVTGQMSLMRELRERPYIIVHEFSHYAMLLKDEYDKKGCGACISYDDSVKTHACIMEWPYTFGDQIDLKDGTVTPGVVYEYCSPANHTDCNAEERENHKSCWDQIVSVYPKLTIPKVDKKKSKEQGVTVLKKFKGELPEEITWVEAKCATQPLIYFDPDGEDTQLFAAAEDAAHELQGLSRGFKRLSSLDEVASERDVNVCAHTLILPVTGPIDFESWSELLEGSRIRAFPIAVADSDADLESLSELSDLTHGRLKIFSDRKDLHFRVQSYLGEIVAEMDCGAGLCFLMDTVLASEPDQARQGARVPIEKYAEHVTFVLSLDQDIDAIFSVVDPAGNRRHFEAKTKRGGPATVLSISVSDPMPGDWIVDLGRHTAGEEARATLSAVVVNHHVRTTFEAHQTKDGKQIQLSVRGYSQQFLLTGLDVEARTVGPQPQRFNLTDTVTTPCSADGHKGVHSNGQYTATLPDDHDIHDLIVTVSNSGRAYSPFWASLTHGQPEPTVPRFFRTQRVSVTPAET